MPDSKTAIIPSNLKVTELKQALTERELSTKGLKKELISRLEEALAAESSNEKSEKIDEAKATTEQRETSPPTELVSDTTHQIAKEESITIVETEKTDLGILSEASVEKISLIVSENLITQENSVTENVAHSTENSELKDVEQENIVSECSSNIQEASALENQDISISNPHSHEELSSLPTELTPEDVSSKKNTTQFLPESNSKEDILTNSNSVEQLHTASENSIYDSVSCNQNTQTTIETSKILSSNSPKIVSISVEHELKSLTPLSNQVQTESYATVDDLNVKVETTTSLPYNDEKIDSTMEDEVVSFQSSPNLDISKHSPENSTKNCSEPQTLQIDISDKPLKFIAITNLTRPFPLGDFEEQLREYGPITQFWIDKFRSHCYVQYENSEGASLCKSMLSGVQFPPDTGKKLDVALLDDTVGLALLERERSSKQRFTLALEGDIPELQEYSDVKKPLLRGLPSTRRSLPQDFVENEDRKRLHTNLPPQIPIDRLFLKTTTKPCLYYKPSKSPSNIEIPKKEQNANLVEVSKPVRNGSVHSVSTGN